MSPISLTGSLSRITRRWALMALLLAASLALVACGSSEDDATETATAAVGGTAAANGAPSTAPATPSDRLTNVTLMLNWTPNAQHAGIYLALQNGWYAEAGINLTVVEPAVAGAEQVVGTGGAEFGVSVAEALLPARAAGIPIVSIASPLATSPAAAPPIPSATTSSDPRDGSVPGKTPCESSLFLRTQPTSVRASTISVVSPSGE